jgi:hypothetical protein
VQEPGALYMKYKELSVALYYDLPVFHDVYHMIVHKGFFMEMSIYVAKNIK